jgi:hypothetical protein
VPFPYSSLSLFTANERYSVSKRRFEEFTTIFSLKGKGKLGIANS